MIPVNRSATELIRGRWPLLLAAAFAILPFGAGPSGAGEGSGLRQVVLTLLFISAAFAIARFPARYHIIYRSIPPTLTLLLMYVFLSVLWSPEVYISFKRAIQVLGVTLLGLAFVVGSNGKSRLGTTLGPVLIGGAILALLVTAISPSFAFSENGWRAFTTNKNTFGQFAALSSVLAIYHYLEARRYRFFWLAFSLLSLVALALSRSGTSLIALMSVAVIFSAMLVLPRLHRSWWPLMLASILVVIAIALMYVVIEGPPDANRLIAGLLAPTGKDVTLSGRTYLWELMAHEALKHPWFGTGYGGFWLGLEGSSGQVAYQVKWGYPGQAHNGYLDLFNELGVIGCLLVLGFVIEHGRNVFRLIGIDSRLGYFHASLLMLVLVLNLAEATLLRTTHLWWIIFVASVIEVGFLTRSQSLSKINRIAFDKRAYL